jgi:6-phosphogluconolactonase (cycloisomerase 2 family)
MESSVSSRSQGFSRVASSLIMVLLVLCFTATGFAQKNLVYIDSNIGLCPTCSANKNSVIAFVNDGTGKLTPVKGQPFKTGGTGIYQAAPGLPIDASDQLIINPEGTLLFAVNMHSNTIAAFTINSDGSLTAVTGSPFASNGPQPAALGFLDNVLPSGGSILTVANADNDPGQTQTAPNFSSFMVTSSGNLTLNTGATITLPTGSSPAQVLVNQKAKLMFGLQLLGTNNQGVLGSYRIKLDGSMNLVNSLTPPGGTQFLGEVQHPLQLALYVGLPDVSQIGVYQFGITNGQVFFKRTVTAPGILPCWLAINKAGTRLYSSQTGSGTVTVYDLTHFLTPLQLQNFTLASGGTFGPTNLALDPTGLFLYVITGSSLHVLNVAADGTLTETVTPRPLPVPPGTVAVGLATLMK